MNKKILVFTLSLMVAAMFATPVMAEIFGNGLTVQTFTKTPFVDPPTLTNFVEIPGNPKLVCDGTIRVGHGAFRTADYAGPLGTGTFSILTLHSKTYLTTPYVTGAGVGGGVYQYTLVIDDGPYGSGTLKGIAKLEWELDMTGMPFVGLWEQWDTAKMVPVEGNLNIKWVSIEGYFVVEAPPFPPIAGWWWTKTTVVS